MAIAWHLPPEVISWIAAVGGVLHARCGGPRAALNASLLTPQS
jgi:hypothetical protein